MVNYIICIYKECKYTRIIYLSNGLHFILHGQWARNGRLDKTKITKTEWNAHNAHGHISNFSLDSLNRQLSSFKLKSPCHPTMAAWFLRRACNSIAERMHSYQLNEPAKSSISCNVLKNFVWCKQLNFRAIFISNELALVDIIMFLFYREKY